MTEVLAKIPMPCIGWLIILVVVSALVTVFWLLAFRLGEQSDQLRYKQICHGDNEDEPPSNDA